MTIKFDQKDNRFTSPEDFISNIQKEGRAFDLLCTLLQMEETVSDATKKTLANIFLQPTHTLTLKSLNRIVSKEFPGQGANYLMKTVWYNQSAIDQSRVAFTFLLLTLIICIAAFILIRSGLLTFKISFFYEILIYFCLILVALAFHLLFYWNVLFRLLGTFHWLKDLMRKNCETVSKSLQDGLELLYRHRERLTRANNESEINTHIRSLAINELEINTHLMSLATELAKYKYGNVQSVAEYLVFSKFPIEEDETEQGNHETNDEFFRKQLKRRIQRFLTRKKIKHFKNKDGRNLEKIIEEYVIKYLKSEQGIIKNQHIINEAAVMIYSTKSIVDDIKEKESKLREAILLEENNHQNRKKLEECRQNIEMKRQFFSYVLSILQTRGPEALKEFELIQLLQWSELDQPDQNFYNITAEVAQIIEKNMGPVIGKQEN